MSIRAVFFDKDGTLIENVPFNVDPDKICFSKGAEAALLALKEKFQFHIVTNQAGVALGLFQEEKLEGVEQKLQRMFQQLGVDLSGFHYCPHHPQGKLPEYSYPCDCRKPKPLLIQKAADKYGIDLNHSWMIGDILDDIESGKRAGCRTILLDIGNETEWIMNEHRTPDFRVKDLEEAALIIATEE